jgi:uncharacterized coiled-coil DUF342 family protein
MGGYSMFWNKNEKNEPLTWKEKATSRTKQIKSLSKRIKELLKSRDYWKKRANELSAKLEEEKKKALNQMP